MSTSTASRPRMAIMIGDPAGVGPEVVMSALATGAPQRTADFFLVGSVEAAQRAARVIGCSMTFRSINDLDAQQVSEGAIDVLEPGYLDPADFSFGQASAEAGRAVKRWMDWCQEAAETGAISGWIMAPIDRTSLKLGINLQDIGESSFEDVPLFRISGSLRLVPLSEHIPLRQVAASITPEAVSKMIHLVNDTMRQWGVAEPRIALAGLNPHARGVEETEVLAPAVQQAQEQGITIQGPISPDTVFRQCLEGRHDVVITMYHDQGQIALKTVAFEGACSVHLGLPYIHVTVPHGSAFDIAGQGIANASSMTAALTTAGQLAAGQYNILR